MLKLNSRQKNPNNMLGKALGTENGEHEYLIMGKTKFHWEQHALGKHWKGHFIWEYDMESKWVGPISLGTTCYIWTSSLGTGNGEHDYLIMGKTISLGTTCYLWRSLGTENGEHDYLIMGKTISLGTTCYLMEIIGNRKWGT
jgi:hypothetical protein